MFQQDADSLTGGDMKLLAQQAIEHAMGFSTGMSAVAVTVESVESPRVSITYTLESQDRNALNASIGSINSLVVNDEWWTPLEQSYQYRDNEQLQAIMPSSDYLEDTTSVPSVSPSKTPTERPTNDPTKNPTKSPTRRGSFGSSLAAGWRWTDYIAIYFAALLVVAMCMTMGIMYESWKGTRMEKVKYDRVYPQSPI